MKLEIDSMQLNKDDDEVLKWLALTSELCEVPLLYNYRIKLMRLLSSYFGTVYLSCTTSYKKETQTEQDISFTYMT